MGERVDRSYIEYEYEPSGWLMFAGIMVVIAGIWNLIEGFVALFRPAYFTGSAAFGSLATWYLLWFAAGLFELIAGYAIIAGRQWARWAGIAIVSLSAIVNILTVPLYPWWSLSLLAIDFLILYALAVRWQSGPGAPAG